MNVFIAIAIVCAFFLAADLLYTKLKKLNRALPRNITAVLLAVSLTACSVVGIVKAVSSPEAIQKKLYMGYQYLLESKPDKALNSVQDIDAPHASVVSILADCEKENYSAAYINADDLLSKPNALGDLAAQTESIKKLAYDMSAAGDRQMTTAEAHKQEIEIASKCCTLLKVSAENQLYYSQAFETAKKIDGGNYSSISKNELRSMLNNEPNNADLLRFSVNYYNRSNDLETAKQLSQRLMKNDDSPENITLYTDVLAQELLSGRKSTSSSSDSILDGITDGNNANGFFGDYDNSYGNSSDSAFDDIYGGGNSGSNIGSAGTGEEASEYDVLIDKNDKETIKYLEKAEEYKAKALTVNAGTEEYSDLMSKYEEYMQKARNVKAERIINYLNSRFLLNKDDTGLYELQLSRLYAACGDKANAKKYLTQLVQKSNEISEDSPIKKQVSVLSSVMSAEDPSEDEINNVVDGLCDNSAFLDRSYVKEQFKSYASEMLRYDRITVSISKIDASEYPVVKAYVNASGQLSDNASRTEELDVDDFTFIDCGFPVECTKVDHQTEDNVSMTSIALVIDCSGSMDGSAEENARKAVNSCIKQMSPQNQQLSIVKYDDYEQIVTPLTSDKSLLSEGVKQLDANGGTNIPGGIFGGIESLKNAVGTKSIILMTDGEDGNSGQIEEAIQEAVKSGINIYTVGLGDVDRSYLENIAAKTGGTYMEALSEKDLQTIYTSLQGFIVNNFCFQYTVKDAAELDPRTLTVGLKDYGVSDTRGYSLKNTDVDVDNVDNVVIQNDEDGLYAYKAQPGKLSSFDAKQGTSVFISGTGFTDDMTVMINGNKIEEFKTVDGKNLCFELKGDYTPGKLTVSLQRQDGEAFSSDELLAISDGIISGGNNASGNATIFKLGTGGKLYASRATQNTTSSAILEGNIVLNDFIEIEGPVELNSRTDFQVGGTVTLNSGSLYGNGDMYITFSKGDDNYGKIAYGGSSVTIANGFSMEFGTDMYTNISLNMALKGFGSVGGNYDSIKLTDDKLVITGEYLNLNEFSRNLDRALNNVPLTKNDYNNSAIDVILGTNYNHSSSNESSPVYITSRTDSFTVELGKDSAQIKAVGLIEGKIGPFEITRSELTIDTSNVDKMFNITGEIDISPMRPFQDEIGADFEIGSKGYYPDTLHISAQEFEINTDDIASIYDDTDDQDDEEDTKPIIHKGEFDVKYVLDIDDYPYSEKLRELVSDVDMSCDSFEIYNYNDGSTLNRGLKAYNSSDPSKYVIIKPNGVAVSINNIKEITLFGAKLGGEISGDVTMGNNEVSIALTVDGHLDDLYHGAKHDGKSQMNIILPYDDYVGSRASVTVMCDETSYSYNTTLTGSVYPEDGFVNYD